MRSLCLVEPCICLVLFIFQITFGCCTIDVLKQLSGEEISRTSTDTMSGDRMGRLATHILGQRRYLNDTRKQKNICSVPVAINSKFVSNGSYYPLYPPSLGVPLDLSLAPEALDIPLIPDILILPSDISPFVKVNTITSSFAAYMSSNLLQSLAIKVLFLSCITKGF